jgi:hypothetical protein
MNTGGPPGRFHDPGDRLEAYLDEVLVRCPRCDALARVTPAPADGPAREPRRSDWLADRRLVCASCALVRTWPAPGVRRSCVTGTDVDPWFGEPLWLRTEVAGHVLWAYNLRHLELLRAYVAATQRTKDRTPGMIHTLLNRLPTWMKEARHRDELLAAIARLHAGSGS